MASSIKSQTTGKIANLFVERTLADLFNRLQKHSSVGLGRRSKTIRSEKSIHT